MPSYNHLDCLKGCISSVKDRGSGAGAFAVHHHVQDGGSSGGMVEFLDGFKAHGLTLTVDKNYSITL